MNEKTGYTPNRVSLARWSGWCGQRTETFRNARGAGRRGTERRPVVGLGKCEAETIEEAPAYEVGEDEPNGAHGLKKTEMRGDGAARW